MKGVMPSSIPWAKDIVFQSNESWLENLADYFWILKGRSLKQKLQNGQERHVPPSIIAMTWSSWAASQAYFGWWEIGY